jgi:hypothetical protein
MGQAQSNSGFGVGSGENSSTLGQSAAPAGMQKGSTGAKGTGTQGVGVGNAQAQGGIQQGQAGSGGQGQPDPEPVVEEVVEEETVDANPFTGIGEGDVVFGGSGENQTQGKRALVRPIGKAAAGRAASSGLKV